MPGSVKNQVMTMNNGQKIPLLGLGTYRTVNVKDAVKNGIECGYRLFDTAMTYDNEEMIGEAIEELVQAKKITREEVFICTKLAGTFMGPEQVKPACQESLRKLKMKWLDLLIIQTPIGMKYVGLDKPFAIGPDGKLLFEKHDIVTCWKAMEKLVDEGLVKSIGVSNFNSEQVDRIIKNCRIKPVTNQIECHAHFPQNEMANFLKERDMFLMAYAPLGSPARPDDNRNTWDPKPLLEEQVIVDLAKKYKKTPAQICLKSVIQRGMVTIPKASSRERILENSQIFDFKISSADMETIAGLNTGKRLFDGANRGLGDQPEYPFRIPF